MFDAIVPAGGSARRLGGADKPGLVVRGRPLLDHVLDAVREARRTVVVGPRRPTAVPVSWCREQPAGGGPVAALAAALELVTAPTALVVAADLPDVAPAIEPLRDALGAHDAAVLVGGGRRNYLCAAWRTDALRSAVSAIGDPTGAAMRALYAGRDVAEVIDDGGWGRDCDTWADVAAAET